MANSTDNEVAGDPAAPDARELGNDAAFPAPPEAVPVPTRSKAGTKRAVLIGVWLVLLAGLIVGINVMGSHMNGTQGGTVKPPANPMPKLDAANLEAHWPQIMAQAAAPPRGSANARYTLAEFGDFQCPQCAKARPLLEKMLAQYPTQVNLIFLHRPFPQMHEWALASGQASEIAAAQGKFWPMYDVLYQNQDNLEPGFYGDYAAKAGMDKAEFQKAFDANQGTDKLAAASRFADSLSVQETPTILVHDNVANTVAIYIGMDTKADAQVGIPYPGLDKLTAEMPWAK